MPHTLFNLFIPNRGGNDTMIRRFLFFYFVLFQCAQSIMSISDNNAFHALKADDVRNFNGPFESLYESDRKMAVKRRCRNARDINFLMLAV